ncbi:hypothetical protein PENSPDRAFT_751447 [Peniophora sp. CONT]|nr:hypothetical protein PENSPDRAFT_751447 [Peniophora sp. CONT]
MEVDMRSPSFLSPRRPMKRSRSPDADEAALGAPSAKRLSLATGNNTDNYGMNMGMNTFAYQQPQDASPGIAPPGPSADERWVAQTGSLSITRPQTPPAEDDAMNMDTEPAQLWPPQAQISGMQQHLQPMQYFNAPDIQVLGTPSYPTPAPSPGPIVLPPLPTNPFLRAEHTSAHTPPIHSLMLPHQIPQQQQQQQRSRFSMGPRPNCELCRNRVEGHYAHFD